MRSKPELAIHQANDSRDEECVGQKRRRNSRVEYRPFS